MVRETRPECAATTVTENNSVPARRPLLPLCDGMEVWGGKETRGGQVVRETRPECAATVTENNGVPARRP